MTGAYVDTTILTNKLLKTGSEKEQAEAALKQYSSTALPVYAIKEFKAGPLSYYVYAYNKIVSVPSLADAFAALSRLAATPQKYRLATNLQSFQAAFTPLAPVTLQAFATKYGSGTSILDALKEELRVNLKLIIFRAWKKRRSSTSDVVQDLSCYDEAPPKEYRQGQLLDLGATTCQRSPCCLEASLSAMKHEVDKLITMLEEKISSTSPRREDQRRLKALKDIRKNKYVFDQKACRDLGDAYFALYCPPGHEILTTNVKDHSELAGVLGKLVTGPSKASS